MNKLHITRTLTLYLKQSEQKSGLEIEEIEADNGRKLLGSGGDFKKQAWPSINALCYLILHTYIVRTTREKLGSMIDIVQTPNNARHLLKTLWGSKHKKKLKWKSTLFKKDPFKETVPYLVTSGSDSLESFQIWIPKEVEIKLLEADKETEILISQLRDLTSLLAKVSKNMMSKLSVELIIDDWIISSSYCRGFLTRGHQIHIHIQWNFVHSLFVCWINSQNKIKLLFPTSSFGKIEKPYDYFSESGNSRLIIPAFEKLAVNSPPGLETCLILTTKGILTKKNQSETHSLLEKHIALRDAKRKISAPIFKSIKLDKKNTGLSKRLEMIEPHNAWENSIISNLKRLFDKAYIFDIPNR